MSFRLVCFLCALFEISSLVVACVHIVFVLADDLGWGDVSFTGSACTINTPTISELAANGIILNNYYVQPVCTPTRAALMSGRYPIHVGLQHGVIKDSVPDSLPLSINQTGANTDVVTLPQYLKQISATLNQKKKKNNTGVSAPDSAAASLLEAHMIGKWHLGFYQRRYTPQMRGFDTFYGYYTGNEEYWNHSSPCWNCGNYTALDLGWHNQTDDVWDFEQSGVYSTNLFAEKAIQVIRQFNGDGSSDGNRDGGDANKSLFLYLPFEAVHGAASCDPDCDHPYGDVLQAPEYYINEQTQIANMNRRIYGGMVGALDDAIRNITQVLKELQMWNETIFVFSSDNGAPAGHFNSEAMTNAPLRGQKGSLWEGGIRGASFIYSPLFGQSRQHYVYQGLMHVSDWYLTLGSLYAQFDDRNGNNHDNNDSNSAVLDMDTDIGMDMDLDGFDLSDALLNNSPSPRTELLHNIDPISGQSAIRVNQWKLLQGMGPGQWYPMYNQTTRMNDNGDNHDIDVDAIDHEKAVQIYLFDISIDPCEYNDVSANNTEIVAQLQAKITAYSKTMAPVQNKNPDQSAEALILDKGVWFSWKGD